MNGRNGDTRNDDPFGFSGSEGWLGGTGGSDTEGGVGGNDNTFWDDAAPEYPDDNTGSIRADSVSLTYDRPAEPDEYSDSYQKALAKVSRHKEDQKSIWSFDFGSGSKADYGLPDWPRGYYIEKYKYGDVAVTRPTMKHGRSHLAAKIMLALWMALGVAAAVIFFSRKEFWVLIWFLIQAVTGVCVYFAISPKNRLKGFPIFLIADAVLTGGLIALRIFTPEPFVRLAGSMESILCVIFAGSIGAGFMTYGIAVYFRSMFRCSCPIDAMCLNSIVAGQRGSATKTYCPIYEFFYNGRKYIVRPDSYNNVKPPVPGEMYKLRINPLYPIDYYDLKRDGLFCKGAIIAGGLWTLGFMIFLIIQCVPAFF